MAEGGDLRIVAVSFITHEGVLGIELVPRVIGADIVEGTIKELPTF